MPLPTLMAARQSGEITGATAAEDPTADLDALREAGIDLDDVTDKLLRDAIDAFLVPMAKLLDGIERKREAIVTNRPAAIEADLPPELEQPLAARVKRAHDEDVARRIWQHDGTLWAPEGTAEVTDRLGWLTIADKLLEEADTLDAFREECVADGLTDVVLLGMGGSSLAPEVFRLSYGPQEGGLRLHVLDSTEPLQIEAVEREIDLAKTLFLVSTKSGGTIETISLFKHFHALQGDGSHYVLITDPGSSLLDLAEENSFRRAFQNDPEIGGRYSALSYFGLVPAALAGIDIRPAARGRAGGRAGVLGLREPGEQRRPVAGPGARRARARRPRQADVRGRRPDRVVRRLGRAADRREHRQAGPRDPPGGRRAARRPRAPTAATACFSISVTPTSRTPGTMRRSPHSPRPATRRSPCRRAGPTTSGACSSCSSSRSPSSAGCWRSTRSTSPTCSRPRTPRRRCSPRARPRRSRATSPRSTPASSRRPTWRSWATCPYSDEIEAAIARLREKVIASKHVATTYGYGPRFLHSTGQFHKGGPAVGRFLQLVHDSDADADIPGDEFDFRTLISAQADGDLQTLRDHGLEAVRVRLNSGDLPGSIDALGEGL